ncbi:ComEA family DNA-binding protein [Achromobacter arsenitoxydans]|uniref:Helix-hairpin-helix DNA-binding motif class 1 domain-containing protein n=1 Tax=Achromobacter arsenitoxydans SY8 TaxID=477184 RepID=H0F8U7_9BURK|nr:helix-hairpin-helix domain-containing protein [Achromobacter arsenitoxydans]EHK65012.1 hypothetical protein KYC_15977 [Achromobacter arsenitoxydans SY8]
MNPFVQPTVACGSPLPQWRRPRREPVRACPRAGQRALRRAFSVLLLSVGLGVAAPPAQAVDLNKASAAELESVRGIGPRTAEVIVRERERGGEFESLEDLTERVRGIGQKKAQALQAAGLTVGAKAAAAGDSSSSAPAAARPAQAKPAQGKPAPARPAASAPAKP